MKMLGSVLFFSVLTTAVNAAFLTSCVTYAIIRSYLEKFKR